MATQSDNDEQESATTSTVLPGGPMQIAGTLIEDTYAEAFSLWASRLVITADSPRLALQAAQAATGMAFSIAGGGCEAGLDGDLALEKTPDGRPGYAVLLFSHSPAALEKELLARIGQAVMPSATSACFNGLAGEKTAKVGGSLRYFGDGFQTLQQLGERRTWRIPVGDGEFIVDETFGMTMGVGGASLILVGKGRSDVFSAAEAASEAVCGVPGVIVPAPGGVSRSPSKPGSRYPGLHTSTNQRFSPALRGQVESAIPAEADTAYELVIDGLSAAAVSEALRVAILAACRPGVLRISANNYGGRLGAYRLRLRSLMQG
jgi:formylmethanofuran--tetrahydromethanopterin N-formyltransferase